MPTLDAFTSVLPLLSWPRSRGLNVAASCHSALEVGGDFYDSVSLSDSSLLLVIADVMGKGVPAAFFADSLRTLIRALAKPGVVPADLLAELNNLMFEELSKAEVFITVQLVLANLHEREWRVANAGHCPLLIADQLGRTSAISPHGIPLGIQMDTVFHDQCCALPPRGGLLLYTDGVTEARDEYGQFFGQERLENWLSRSVRQRQTAADLKTSLLRELAGFQGSEHGVDDQTFLVLLDETSPAVNSLRDSDNFGWARQPPLDPFVSALCSRS